MSGQVGLEVGRLGEPLGTARLGTGVRPITGVDSQVCPQVEVQRETLATAL